MTQGLKNGNSKIVSSSILKDEVARLDGGHTLLRGFWDGLGFLFVNGFLYRELKKK